MDGKGALIIFCIGFVLAILYFSLYGFSIDVPVRWGQYAGLLLAGYLCFEEIIKL